MTATTVAARAAKQQAVALAPIRQGAWTLLLRPRGDRSLLDLPVPVMVLGSLKTQREILAKPPKLLPEHASLANFANGSGN